MIVKTYSSASKLCAFIYECLITRTISSEAAGMLSFVSTCKQYSWDSARLTGSFYLPRCAERVPKFEL